MKDVIESYFKIGEKFIPINDFKGKLPDDFYIDGAIICTIEDHEILRFEHWDLVNQLWYYIIDSLIELRANQDYECSFPDQPCTLRFEVKGEIMVKITIGEESYTVNRNRFIELAAKAAREFFLKIKTLLPQRNDDWNLHLEKANSLLEEN